MKVLFVIDTFIDGGASNAMIGLIEGYGTGVESKIFTRLNYSTYNKVEIGVGNGNALIEFIQKNNFDFIHWFRTNLSVLAHEYFSACEQQQFRSPFIFLTLCQVPSFFLFRLTLQELTHFDYFIFICKEAYNHPYHQIIPKEKKTMIYFGTHNMHVISPREHTPGRRLRFGRGSSLNKCPSDMIENYLEIAKGIESEFIIVGDGDASLIHKKIEQLQCADKVKLISHLSREEWIEFLRSLDIYLYQLPEDAYSAIDATIQDAMLAEVPVVIMGPDAPKELVDNEVNGFAAANRHEFISYSTRLANDISLRETIGKKGRAQIIQNFSHDKTIRDYQNLYKSVNKKTGERWNIPLTYKLLFTFEKLKFSILQRAHATYNRL